MSTKMDKSLMALMGIEEGSTDITQDNQDTGGSFFDSASDSDSEMLLQPSLTKKASAGPSSVRQLPTRFPSPPAPSSSKRVPESVHQPMRLEDDDDDDDLLPPMESILQRPVVTSNSASKRTSLAARMKTKSGETASLRMSEPASVDLPTLEYNTMSYQPSFSLLPSLEDSTLDSQATQELRDELRELQEQDPQDGRGKLSENVPMSDSDGGNAYAEPKAPATLSKREQKRLQAEREKEMLEIQRQKLQLIRNAPLPIQQRVAKKFTLASLIEKAQNQPFSTAQPQHPSSGEPLSKPAVISLLDTDSEDEKREHQQKKRVQQQAFLMNPLSKSMQKMKIDPPVSSTSSSAKSPTKPNDSVRHHPQTGQPPNGMSIEEFNWTMRRQLAKHNLRRRMESEADAKKMGIWKSPEEYVAEQLEAEDALEKQADAGEDGDNEEEEDDEDYEPENDKAGGDDDEGMDLGSGDEEEIELAKARKQNELVDDEAVSNKKDLKGGQKTDSEANDAEDEEEDNDDEQDESEEDDEDMSAGQIQRRRPGRRRTVIGDDDDVEIVVVHSKEPPKAAEVDEAALSSELPESDDSDQESEGPRDSDGEADQAGMLEEDDTQSSISGALAFLSGNFGTQATQNNHASPVVSPDGTGGPNGSMWSDSITSPSMSISASLEQHPPPAQPDRNAFDVLQTRMRRLEKREQKEKEVLKGKSAFIEYEAEEEDDEFKGFGGVDYESDKDNDDYDMEDGMLDHGVKLKAQDVAAVRQLHMEQEQAQHDKDISELVHGIAAGNLWKRRSGRVDDLDLLDTDDEEEVERRRRIKKLKVTEKFEKLADNPQTAAFARAFEKNIGDEELMFLQEPVDSDEEEKTVRKLQMRGTLSETVSDIESDQEGEQNDSEDDDLMKEVAAAVAKKKAAAMDEDEEESDEELLSTDKRRERLATARTVAMDEDWDHRPSIGDRVDEYEATLKSRRMVENLLRGVHDEELEKDPDLQGFQDSFSTLDDRIVDRTSHNEGVLASGGAFTTRNDETLEFLQLGRRRVARTNSSFTTEERRKMFLSTVSEDSRGANASSRMVKEVNRRKVTFRSGVTVKKTAEDGSVASVEVETVSVSTNTKNQRMAPASGSILLSALGGNDF